MVLDKTDSTSVARNGSVAVGGAEGYVVGMNIRFYDSTVVPDSPLTAVRLGKGSIGKPKGSFFFGSPRAFAHPNGRLQLVWAEPLEPRSGVTALYYPPEPAGSIWTATFDPRSGWTTPQRVFATTDRINWDIATNSGTAPKGGHVIAFPTLADSPMVLLRSDDAQWNPRPVPYAGSWISASSGKRGRVSVAYTAAVQSTARDHNSVFFGTSDDNGRNWSKPHLVAPSGVFPAYAPTVLRDSRDRLHLVWIQQLAVGQALRHVASDDGGQAWSTPDDAGIVQRVNNPVIVVDRCDRIVVLSEHWAGEGRPGHLDQTIWDSTWRRPAHVFTDWTATGIAATMDASGGMVLTFTGRPRYGDTSHVYTYISTSPAPAHRLP
jgi:hypothetical protein